MNLWPTVFESRPLDLSESGLKKTLELLKLVFPNGQHFSEEYLNWLYLQNPLGLALGADVYEGDSLVTHFALMPLSTVYDGVEQKAVLVLNIATHPDYRAKGLFKMAGIAALEEARSQGVDHALGVANGNSTKNFLRQLNFSLITPLDVKVGFGGLPEPDTARSFKHRVFWGQEELAWRLRRPGQQYFWVQDQGLKKVYTQISNFGPYVNMLSTKEPLDCDKNDLGFKLNPQRAWIGCDSSRDWSGSCYFDLPEFLKPSPLNLIFLDLTQRERALKKEEICFNALDFDAY
jgi:GNAT superfamily N-acetyltransferase